MSLRQRNNVPYSCVPRSAGASVRSRAREEEVATGGGAWADPPGGTYKPDKENWVDKECHPDGLWECEPEIGDYAKATEVSGPASGGDIIPDGTCE